LIQRSDHHRANWPNKLCATADALSEADLNDTQRVHDFTRRLMLKNESLSTMFCHHPKGLLSPKSIWESSEQVAGIPSAAKAALICLALRRG